MPHGLGLYDPTGAVWACPSSQFATIESGGGFFRLRSAMFSYVQPSSARSPQYRAVVVPADALDWPLKALVLRRVDIKDHHPAPLRPDWRTSDSELCQTF